MTAYDWSNVMIFTSQTWATLLTLDRPPPHHWIPSCRENQPLAPPCSWTSWSWWLWWWWWCWGCEKTHLMASWHRVWFALRRFLRVYLEVKRMRNQYFEDGAPDKFDFVITIIIITIIITITISISSPSSSSFFSFYIITCWQGGWWHLL